MWSDNLRSQREWGYIARCNGHGSQNILCLVMANEDLHGTDGPEQLFLSGTTG